MDYREYILDLYGKGYSFGYISQCVYKLINKSYFEAFRVKKNSTVPDCYKMSFCKNLVESTILEHTSA